MSESSPLNAAEELVDGSDLTDTEVVADEDDVGSVLIEEVTNTVALGGGRGGFSCLIWLQVDAW